MTFSLSNISPLSTHLPSAPNKVAQAASKVTANSVLSEDKVTLGWQQAAASYSPQPLANNTEPYKTTSDNKLTDSNHLPQLLQAMLDQRTGFDRKKWEELQEKIEALQSLDKLTESEQQELDGLLKAQAALMQEAAERMRQQAEQQDRSEG